jgi:hypothetical protein
MNFINSSIAQDAYRVVESQARNSTRQLTDSDEEQEHLEDMVEKSKPPYVKGSETLNYLIKTPFRYPPLKEGSRFGNKYEHGIFYASLELKTALCEKAFWVLNVLLDSEEEFAPFFPPITSFKVNVTSAKTLDLTKGKWLKEKNKISNPKSHTHSQKIGDAARDKKVEVIKFFSAREEGGINLAVLTPNVFLQKKPKQQKHLSVYVDQKNVSFTCDVSNIKHSFSVDDFNPYFS